MSAPISPDLVIADTATAFEAVLGDVPLRVLGRSLGHAHKTISARGCDLRAWPADELIKLALAHPRIYDALVGGMTGAAMTTAQGDAQAQARGISTIMAGDIERLLRRLEDGRLDDRELRDTDTDLADLQTRLSQVRAAIRAQRRGHQ